MELPPEVRERLSDELIDELLAGARTEEELVGPGGLLADLTRRLVERAMSAELTEHLGYEPHREPPGGAGNTRNGGTPKTLATEHGPVRIKSPRDRDGSFELYSRINIGVVVAGDDAYTIPTVFDADKRSLSELAAELTRVTERALSGELSSPELSGATFTLWDLGPLAVSRATPLVVAPQAAAVSTGAVREVALVRDANLVAGRAITITLACDHRILYGSQAGRFFNRITTLIEEPTL